MVSTRIAYPTPGPANALGRPMCYRCRRPQVSCVCELVQPVDNRTRVVIVQHGGERHHPFGTVRLARLGLRNSAMHVATRDADDRNSCPPQLLSNAALLFPARGSERLDRMHELPSTLVVLDGTWSTAAKLRRDIPWLQALPTVALAPTQPGRYRIRKAPRPEVQLSTIEAIVAALLTIEPDTSGLAGLLDAFDGMIDRQIALAHSSPPRPRP